MTSRRKFIRDATLATGGVLLSTSSFGKFFIGKKPFVVIIGAGFAGLAAAKRLHERKINFIILEARNRIGGRVFSHTMDEKENLVIELGAEWVGDSHTRLKELAGEYKLILDNNQFETDLIYQGKHYPAGQWNYSDQWNSKFAGLIRSYHNMSQAEKIKLDKIDWWRYLVNNGCEGKDLDLRDLLDSTDFGESIRHVSAFAALAEYAESSPKNEMDFKIRGGNGKLAEKIAEEIGYDKIRKQMPVTRVVQNTSGVKVYCENGEVFSADKVICTVPTYAAKKIKWEPGLAPDQVNAMNELQYARINKNPLMFSERFWREDFDMVTDQSSHYFYHATKNQTSKKGVLISYTIGDKAAVVANQPDEWKTQMAALSLSHFGDVKGKLEKQANYYWGNDSFSMGAYAIYGKGQWFRIMPILKRTHMHTLFAGEHLAEWQGFMEGALVTGEDAAKRI